LGKNWLVTFFQLKEANRYFWMVKGHLIPDGWSEKDIMSVYESYFNRIWGNHEATSHQAGFEQAWAKRHAEK
tara:strand:- start:7640 stop:7855 length:216 start_codon:yes stop_codon:yes gene_type:complete